MAKTRVLLAFGFHKERVLEIGADKRFFRKSISRFLKGTKGSKAAVIMENFQTYEDTHIGEIRKLRLLKGTGLKHFKEGLTTAMKEKTNKTKKYFESGEIPPGREEDFMGRYAWGFEELMLSINSKNPGQIEYFEETPPITAFQANWDVLVLRDGLLGGILAGEPMDMAISYIKATANMIVRRDKETVRLAEELAKEDPEKAIIIPRDFVHNGMVVLFDPENFDVRVDLGADLKALDFADEIASKSYKGELPDEVYRQYGLLQLLLFVEMGKRKTITEIFLEGLGKKHASIMRFKKRIRRSIEKGYERLRGKGTIMRL